MIFWNMIGTNKQASSWFFLSWKEKSIFSSLLYHFFMIIVRSMLQYKPRFPLFMQNIVVLKTKSYVILITLIRRRVFATLAMTTTLIRENTKFEFFLSIGIKSMSIYYRLVSEIPISSGKKPISNGPSTARNSIRNPRSVLFVFYFFERRHDIKKPVPLWKRCPGT